MGRLAYHISLIVSISLSIIFSLSFFDMLKEDPFEISFYNVGMGDAVQVSYSNLNFLIDGGPDFLISWLQVFHDSPFTCDYDFIVLTHPHLDHLGGLSRLVDHCFIKKVFINRIFYDSKTYKNFLNKIELLEFEDHLEIESLHKGQVIKFKDLKLHILWPPKFEVSDLEKFDNNPNNTSIVILLDFYDFEVLFMGDLEKEFHEDIKRSLEDLSSEIQEGVDILKVPHQGSKDALDKDFLLWLKPKMAVLSIGPNSYGHPDASYIEFLDTHGIELLRTDEVGTVVFKPCYEAKKRFKKSC